jgi:hypothetical protein
MATEMNMTQETMVEINVKPVKQVRRELMRTMMAILNQKGGAGNATCKPGYKIQSSILPPWRF